MYEINEMWIGIENLKDLTDKTKEYLQGRLDIIESDQMSHIEKTDRLDNKLVDLGQTVDDMYTEVNEVNFSFLINLISLI